MFLPRRIVQTRSGPVSEAGNYDIVCDLNNNTIKVTKSAYQETDVNQSALWMVGDATPNGWSLNGAILMSQDKANPAVYAATADLKEGEFKIAVNKYGDYEQLFYQRDSRMMHDKGCFG